ncbi:MAG: NADP-dependent 3-hydroxy acid dehydrogenase YdfG/tetratricopeptide (TPR) repeat protein [Saprospiraceae bacterium]|jgi:NADP-dependent 3-hydroxy acid dehydrogenase YdfG/tetratricopeptide (TPR) repeat protein
MSQLYIAYCEANKSIASDIEQKLKKVKISLSPLSAELDKDDKGLTFLIAETKLPGILLLSDNFLKNEICMKNMLNFVQKSAVAENMKIVIIDGQYPTGDVETSFDRVSNVIKYMNYWQERYLEMRKQKRTIDPSQEEAFDEKLLNVKNVSSEVGDFLREVRGKDFWTYDQLVYNNFEIFFKKFGSVGQHKAYIKVAGNDTPNATKTITTAPPVINLPSEPIKPVVVPVSKKEDIAPEILIPKSEPIAVETVPVLDNISIPKLPNEKQNTVNANVVSNTFTAPIKKAAEINAAITNKPLTLHEKLANQLQQDKSTTISELEEEELIIAEVLQSVESGKERKNIINQTQGNNLSAPADPPEVKPIPNEATSQQVLENVFDHESQDFDERKEIEEIIDEEITNLEEEDMNEMEDKMEEIEDDFDIMDGIEIEDITGEFDDEYEDEYEDEITEDPEEHTAGEKQADNYSLEDIFNEDKEGKGELADEKELHLNKTRNEMSLSAAMNAANAYMMSGAHGDGMKAFETLLEDYPNNVDIRYHYAHNLREEVNDQEKATAHFEKIIKLEPKHHSSYKALAEIAEQNNDFLLAKSYYEKVVNLNPKEQGIYYKLGLITAGFYAEKPKLAVKYFKKAILQNPNHEDAYYRLASILSEDLGKDKKALINYLKILEINPKHPFANYDVALLYYKMDDQENAAKYYEKAWQINSELKTQKNDVAFHYEKLAKKIPVLAPAIDKTPTPFIDNDKVILITGATSGIGRATAAKFAEHGFRLLLTGRRADRLEALKADFETTYDTKVKTLEFDVRNLEEVKSMVNNLEEEWRNVDVLINNAGLAKGYAPIHEGDVDHWDTMIDTNIKGLLYLTRAVAPHMVARKSGHIINICSSAGKEVYPNGNVYCATKHAVDALTLAMRLDLYKHNIRVGQVSPSHVEETEFALVRYEDAEKAKIYTDFQPLKSSDVADAIFYIVNAPAHVNVNDIVLSGKQQANNTNIDRSGR